MKKISLVYGLDQVPVVTEQLWQFLQQAAVMTLAGSLGAGKTTLVQGLLRRAGVKGPIQSPTFSYVHVYRVGDARWYHFDLYRLHDLHEFIDAGFAEYLYQPGSKVLIEWPEIVMPLLERNVCEVTIDYEGRESRRLMVQCKK
jgi:tRNA threonylcarbamoyladenosine biosynthesis protein TsaE